MWWLKELYPPYIGALGGATSLRSVDPGVLPGLPCSTALPLGGAGG